MKTLAYSFFKDIKNFSKNGCLFLKKKETFRKTVDCFFSFFGRPRCVMWFPTKNQKNLKRLRNFSQNGCLFLSKNKKPSKNGCFFLRKSRNFSLQERLFLIRTVSYERGTPVGSYQGGGSHERGSPTWPSRDQDPVTLPHDGHVVQGYLAHKKPPPPRSLQQHLPRAIWQS